MVSNPSFERGCICLQFCIKNSYPSTEFYETGIHEIQNKIRTCNVITEAMGDRHICSLGQGNPDRRNEMFAGGADAGLIVNHLFVSIILFQQLEELHDIRVLRRKLVRAVRVKGLRPHILVELVPSSGKASDKMPKNR
jgi:hypothetical protein